MDRAAHGVLATTLDTTIVDCGSPLLGDEVILELKFVTAMPNTFKDLVAEFQLTPSTASKYRRCTIATGLVPQGPLNV
jgi:hypothetical protein